VRTPLVISTGATLSDPERVERVEGESKESAVERSLDSLRSLEMTTGESVHFTSTGKTS
jgi:hypothetical protein